MELIERLKAERSALIARLSKIEAIVAEHDALQQKVAALLAEQGKDTDQPTAAPTISSRDRESRGRRVTAEVADFESAIFEILRVTTKPLDRNELLEICQERGISVGGKDPLNTLGARMSRMGGVTNVRGQGYFLESRVAELSNSASESEQSTAAIEVEVADDKNALLV